jgi:hypothetical protein
MVLIFIAKYDPPFINTPNCKQQGQGASPMLLLRQNHAQLKNQRHISQLS